MARARPRVDPVRIGRHLGWVGLAFVGYLLFGLISSLVFGIITGDAWSRLGNAYYVLFSRDPHLAAIGFVWNPLPSLVQLPLLPLKAIWPAMVDRAVAASLMSALFMALAVRELWRWLRDLRVTRPAAFGLTVAFAAHPMIVIYGGNGMSEAPFLWFLLVAGRAFSSWLGRPDVGRLAVTGIALALAYLTRYEAIAAIAAVILATGLVATLRTSGPLGARLLGGAADAAIVGAPPVAAFAAWALASWIIVGSPFETFTSVYGNASQVGLSVDQIRASAGGTPLAMGSYMLRQIVGLEIALPVVLALAGGIALWRRDTRLVAPIAVFGSVVVMSLLTFIAGGSFGWLRFVIVVIPLVAIAGGIVVAGVARAPLGRRTREAKLLATGAMAALALVALPMSVGTMFNANLAREETPKLEGLIAPGRIDPMERRSAAVGDEVAAWLDARDLPRGSVVVDVAFGFWIVLQSSHPEQFVITPDRDFERVVDDPAAFGARYLLVSPSGGLGSYGALERAHPGLYATGGGIATLVREFRDPVERHVMWRLYEVDEG